MATDMTILNQYFLRESTKEQDAWGITHDVGNILLHYIQDYNVKVTQSFNRKLEELNPNSTVQEIANLFHDVGLHPEWLIWWKKEGEKNEEVQNS